MASREPRTPNDLAVERTDLALSRSLMAADRTLMAWIRTGLSALSFGFTVYKFLVYVRQSLSSAVLEPAGPRRFGLVLIGLGTASMMLGLFDYYRVVRGFDANVRPASRSVFYIGGVAVLLGFFLLTTILIHREVF